MNEGLRLFLNESQENLEKLDRELIALEAKPDDPELLRGIFRRVHTIKGMCGYLELRRLENVTHVAEEVLVRLRDGKLPVSPPLVQAILATSDTIKGILAALESTEQEPAGDDRELVAALQALVEGRAERAEPAAAATVQVTEDGAPARAEAQALRVDVRVLDRLMTRTEELVLVRNRLSQLAQADESSPYRNSIQELHRMTSDLQEVVMQTRMQDIGHAWRKLPRILRDVADASGKHVELKMLGAHTQVDRQVLDAIEDPFIHMVRNSVDHGIEPPAARRAAGKPERGLIVLRAFQEGGNIIVEITDDGAGIDLEAVRRKAVATGRLSAEEAAATRDEDLIDFLFEPGFSTAAATTAISGRGVGMDIVRTKVQSIGGSVTIRSRRGEGTTVRYRIPLTLAIGAALIVTAGGLAFAIPQANVVELVSAGADSRVQVEALHSSRVLRLRERLLTLVWLDQLLGLAPAGAAAGGRAPSEQAVVVVLQLSGQRFGLVVDSVVNTEEIVVKPLSRLVAGLTVYAGTTILGDGRIIMILDPVGLATRAGLSDADEIRETTRASEVMTHAESDEVINLLLFRSGGKARQAVPMALVSRLEEVPRERIEFAADRHVLQYRGALMPLLPAAGFEPGRQDPQHVVVFSDGSRSMGLMVEKILDIMSGRLQLHKSAKKEGVLGTVVVAGEATEIVDIHHYLRLAHPDWFGINTGGAVEQGRHVLVVDDSPFFRSLLTPFLRGCGYGVTVAADGQEALAALESGQGFDAILCDIEMPTIDGVSFARQLKAEGRLSELPLIALTSRSSRQDREVALQAGFHDYLLKFDQDAVVAALKRAFGAAAGGAR